MGVSPEVVGEWVSEFERGGFLKSFEYVGGGFARRGFRLQKEKMKFGDLDELILPSKSQCAKASQRDCIVPHHLMWC